MFGILLSRSPKEMTERRISISQHYHQRKHNVTRRIHWLTKFDSLFIKISVEKFFLPPDWHWGMDIFKIRILEMKFFQELCNSEETELSREEITPARKLQEMIIKQVWLGQRGVDINPQRIAKKSWCYIITSKLMLWP